ncbi:MAG: lipid-binding SYLF domain-containing protein [Thermodesulfobacteriota bacterium]
MDLMKRLGICFILAFLVLGANPDAGFSTPRAELENRLEDCARALKDMLDAPDGGIPADLLRRSRAIVVFPAVLKAGLGVGGHYGRGIVLRRDPSKGKWGPPAFVRLLGGSFGWQVGIQSTDLVLLVMSDVNLRSLFRDRVTIGADASVAAGPIGRDASATTDIDLSAGMLSYSRAKGLFAGVAIKGSILEVDWGANESFYGSDLSVIDIFFRGKGKLSPAAQRVVDILNRASR